MKRLDGLLWFRRKVMEEARHQRELSAAGQLIPPHLRCYARLSGAFIALLGAVGGILIWLLLASTGYLFVTLLGFCGVLVVGGVIQLVRGRHLLSGTR